MEYLLTGEDMTDLAGHDTKIMSYTDLYNHKDIESLFDDGHDNIIVLYVQDKSGNSISGHWVCLNKYPNMISFFDPYGLMPDSQLDFNSKKKKEELNLKHRYLNDLLLDYTERGGKVEFNEMRFQKKDKKIATCGRHVGIRCHFSEIPLKRYQNIFKKMRDKGFDLDEVAVDLSNAIVGRVMD